MSSKFRVLLNLDGLESRLVACGTSEDEPVHIGDTGNSAYATPRLQINPQTCVPEGGTDIPDGTKIRV